MTARAGMTHLIARLRAMTETAAADYSVDGLSYWSDGQLQDVLDGYRTVITLRPLEPTPEYVGGRTEWHDYPVGSAELEEPDSDAPYWSLADGTGHEIDTSLYTLDPLGGLIRFSADQRGAILFLKARSYLLNGAAAEVWRHKMGHSASLYDFRAEDQQFNRGQWFDHCRQMAEYYDRRAGLSFVPLTRRDL